MPLKSTYRSLFGNLLPVALLMVSSLVFWRCAVNPATGKQQLSFIGEAEEIAIGRQNDEQIVAEMGLYDDPELQAYVQDLGLRLARQSERPDLPWTFRVVDDPAVNAFALPGGFIYVTRGILGHMGSEAELAGVLGHEIGHVTARHSVNRMSKAQLASIGLGIGAIVSEDVANLGGAIQTGLGLLFLKFSRSDESQADELGVRYVSRNGYPPAAMAEVFGVLEGVGQASGAGSVPNWLATHPNPGNRRQKIEAMVPTLSADLRNAPWRSEPFLDRIDGIVFGPDPRQGFFEGARFYHPDLRFQLDFPEGWQTENQSSAVLAQSPQKDAVLALTLAQESSPSAAAQAFFQQEGVEPGSSWVSGLRGFDAETRRFRVSDGQTALRGGVAFVALGDRVFRLLGYSLEDAWSNYDGSLGRAVASFSTLTDRKILAIEANRVELVRLDRDLSIDEFARRYPSAVPNETLALINHLDPGEVLRAGTRAKRVVGSFRKP